MPELGLISIYPVHESRRRLDVFTKQNSSGGEASTRCESSATGLWRSAQFGIVPAEVTMVNDSVTELGDGASLAPRRFGMHTNAFGFLRMLLASLVIVSHTPEIADGSRRREILTYLFHSISFGELAVGGFFIISGFLITSSYLNSSSVASYLRKRIARIYPGFLVSSLICLIIVTPLSGSRLAHGWGDIAAVFKQLVVLGPPNIAGVFAGTHYAALNAAAWTIQYEFACYLLIVVLGKAGVLRSPQLVAVVALACLLIHILFPEFKTAMLSYPVASRFMPGGHLQIFRLVGLFLAGTALSLGQNRVRISAMWAMIAFGLLCATLFIPFLADIGLAVFGSYFLISMATLGSGTFLAKINNRNDISYGLYLYAWPIEKLLFWWHFSDSLVVVGVSTWVLATTAGAMSWFLVEKPLMRWGRSSSHAIAQLREPPQACTAKV